MVKPLKEMDATKALEKYEKYELLLHREKGTAIKIPEDVLKVIEKVNNSTIQVDILAHALLLRSKADDSKAIDNWKQMSNSLYPSTKDNEVFSKFLQTVLSQSDNTNPNKSNN